MRSHVLLQVTRRTAIEDALVFLIWLFSCMLPHHVNFQFISTQKLTNCASVRRTDGQTKVFQEVLADLKRGTKEENEDLNMKKWSKNTNF